MYQEDLVGKAVETYYSSTEITTCCTDSTGSVTHYHSKYLNYSALIEFLDFNEILSFIKSVFSSPGEIRAGIRAFHTYCTQTNLFYNIVFIYNGHDLAGAVISGPVLLYYPDEESMEKILMDKQLPLQRMELFKSIMRKVPIVASERMCHLGKTLYALCGPKPEKWSSVEQMVHGGMILDDKALYNKLINMDCDEKEENRYRTIYEFLVEIKNAIMHGSLRDMNMLLDKYAHFFWNRIPYGNNNSLLRNRCIIINTIAFVFAVQANAPYARMMYIFERFMEKLNTFNTADEIIKHMFKILETFTHEVAVSICNTNSLHVNRILRYIRNHYNEKITLAKLAEITHLNPCYLSSLIKKETGMSLAENINRIRIEESKFLLVYTNKPVSEIACAIGYSYQSHINSVFKRLEGMTPLEYRIKNTRINSFTD